MVCRKCSTFVRGGKGEIPYCIYLGFVFFIRHHLAISIAIIISAKACSLHRVARCPIVRKTHGHVRLLLRRSRWRSRSWGGRHRLGGGVEGGHLVLRRRAIGRAKTISRKRHEDALFGALSKFKIDGFGRSVMFRWQMGEWSGPSGVGYWAIRILLFIKAMSTATTTTTTTCTCHSEILRRIITRSRLAIDVQAECIYGVAVVERREKARGPRVDPEARVVTLHSTQS